MASISKEGILKIDNYMSIENIVQIGTGGSGGYVNYFLSRLLYSLKEAGKTYNYVICDGDQVEESNLCRQNFIEADIGKNKAEKLAQRYGSVYGLKIRYKDEYIEKLDTLSNLIKLRSGSIC